MYVWMEEELYIVRVSMWKGRDLMYRKPCGVTHVERERENGEGERESQTKYE